MLQQTRELQVRGTRHIAALRRICQAHASLARGSPSRAVYEKGLMLCRVHGRQLRDVPRHALPHTPPEGHTPRGARRTISDAGIRTDLGRAPTFMRAVVGSCGRGSQPPLRYRKQLGARGQLHIVAAGCTDAEALGRPVLLVRAPNPIDRV